jgi:Ca2+-binding EF-hand superfamily protein
VKVLGVLREVGFDLTREEVTLLGTHFCHGTEEVTGIDEISELVDPIIEPPKPKPTLPKREYVEPASVVLDIMTHIAVQVDKYQLLLPGEFSVYDKRHLGTISKEAFRDVLLALPSPPSEKDLGTLIEFYLNTANQEINYESFCQELDEFGGARVRHNPSLTTKILQDIPQPVNEAADVVRRLKLALFASKTPAESLFNPYDTSHSGLIPCLKLRPILNDFGFQAAEDEYERLAIGFQDQRLPEKFNYKKLCQAMNEIQLTQDDLALSRTGTVKKTTSPQILRFATELRGKLMARHKNVRTPFNGVKNAAMPQSDFRRCIESFGLVVKEAEMQQLLREYRINMQCDIDWQRFCQDVEANATV